VARKYAFNPLKIRFQAYKLYRFRLSRHPRQVRSIAVPVTAASSVPSVLAVVAPPPWPPCRLTSSAMSSPPTSCPPNGLTNHADLEPRNLRDQWVRQIARSFIARRNPTSAKRIHTKGLPVGEIGDDSGSWQGHRRNAAPCP
jgi:hypothetical protein